MNEPLTQSSPHISGARDIRWSMNQVLIALVPGICVYVVLFGPGILIHLAIAAATALVLENLALRWQRIDPQPFLHDGSVLVLACLVTLAIPPYAPWWVTVLGVAFAVLIGKHAFGGLGHNIFNPAMVGYIFLLLCFPRIMGQWPAAGLDAGSRGLIDSASLIFTSALDSIDGRSGATALDHVKTQATLMRMQSEMHADNILGLLGGRGWEWINVAFLAGGGWLLFRRVVRWRLPLSFLGGLGLAASIGFISDPELHRGLWFHFLTGAGLLAAFFIVTDPVSSATTPKGMLVFGFGAGVCTYLIREFGSYPDGVAFAIVLMNACAPLIDRLTQPRLYGTQTKETK
ncbi:MAG: electron transport complex protein RnfD [Gammaproteobacteria bacterium]